MSRIYVCDRCQAKLPTWFTTTVEIPSSFMGKTINIDLCNSCLAVLRTVVKNFMDNLS